MSRICVYKIQAHCKNTAIFCKRGQKADQDIQKATGQLLNGDDKQS